MSNPSPLRYPGGKYKISPLIELLLDKAGDHCSTYVEPFAGGAGVAIDLLLREVVSEIVINDFDRAIYSFWKAVVHENDALIDKIYTTPVTLVEWENQRRIYDNSTRYSLDFAFATFFLNRTNHSGILSSGPIGGQAQGKWKVDARYKKEELISKIKKIGQFSSRIHVFNRDVCTFVKNQLPRYAERAFVYFDPPYFRRGQELYKNFFTTKLHRKLCEQIKAEVLCPWIVSYDDMPEIREIYEGVPYRSFSLHYSLANNGSGQEIMFFQNERLCPSKEEIASVRMERQFLVDGNWRL